MPLRFRPEPEDDLASAVRRPPARFQSDGEAANLRAADHTSAGLDGHDHAAHALGPQPPPDPEAQTLRGLDAAGAIRRRLRQREQVRAGEVADVVVLVVGGDLPPERAPLACTGWTSAAARTTCCRSPRPPRPSRSPHGSQRGRDSASCRASDPRRRGGGSSRHLFLAPVGSPIVRVKCEVPDRGPE